MIEAFAKIVGEANAIRAGDGAMAPYLTEWRGTYRGTTPIILKPASVDEVSAILKLAHETRTPIITQGGNTGLVGAQIPQGEILLSMQRMKRIREIDAASDALIVEAGVTLAEAQAAAEQARRLFPLSLASEGSATIGGNIATNAGGTAVIAYGNMRELVLGLEVVLASGEVLHGLKRLRKDNAGYDLKQLFIGSEGTLGIITAASLRLFPRVNGRAVAIIGLADIHAALRLLSRMREGAGLSLTALEILPRFGLDLMVKHMAARDPLPLRHPWYALVELSGPEDFNFYMEKLAALLPGADAVVAHTESQAQALWAIREGMSEAQKREGPSLKHDVSVPVARLASFVETVLGVLMHAYPQLRPLPFGHAGDGNLHFNISVDPDFAAKSEVSAIIHRAVVDFGGSIAAEHGVGLMKRELLEKVKSPVEMAIMRGLKRQLDPLNILNPGRVLTVSG